MTKDANKKSWKAEQERIKKEMQAEMMEWEALGVHPATTIQIDPMIADNEIFSMWNFLVHKGVIDKDEYWCYKQERLLNKLKSVRGEITPFVEEQRRKALHDKIAVPGSAVPAPDIAAILDKVNKKH